MQVDTAPRLTVTQRAEIERWLLRSLDDVTLNGSQLPLIVSGRLGLYLDGKCKTVKSGVWEISSEFIFASAPNSSMVPPYLTRLGILTGVASLCGLLETSAVQEALLKNLAIGISDTVKTFISVGLVQATKPVTFFGVAADRCTFAACIEGNWYTPNGAPTTVDETWLTFPL